MACYRCGFRGNSFHHVAVAANRPDVVIEQFESRTIEICRQPAFGDGHAHAVCDALTEWSGGGLDTRGQAVFGMPRRLAADLPEILDLIERQGRRWKNFALRTYFSHARQMQQGIEQHGSVPIGKHEAVAVGPDWIFRVITQKLLPQTVGDRSESHRRTGMARVRLLHRVHRKSANRVDTQLIELCTGGDRLATQSHKFSPRKSASAPVPRSR